MPVKTWRFLHPNDGTVPYLDNEPERNRPLYDRIQDLEDTVESLQQRITEYVNTIERLSSTPRQLNGFETVRNNTVYSPIQTYRTQVEMTTAEYHRNCEIDGYFKNLIRNQSYKIADAMVQENQFNITIREMERGVTQVRVDLRVEDRNALDNID